MVSKTMNITKKTSWANGIVTKLAIQGLPESDPLTTTNEFDELQPLFEDLRLPLTGLDWTDGFHFRG